MKTIKCKITNSIDVSEYLRKYNSVLHISYNRLKKHVTQPNIKKEVNEKFKDLNSFIIQNAIIQAQGILKSHRARKLEFEKKNPDKKFKEIMFGGRQNLKQYLRGLKTKSEFKNSRLMPMSVSGETRCRGNRLFNLFIEDNLVQFKPKKGIQINIEFTCSKKQKDELLKVQALCQRKEFAVAISMNNEHLWFCYDEEKVNQQTQFFSQLKETRVLGIDQNPKYLGISVLQFNSSSTFEVLHKEVIDLSKLTTKSGKSVVDAKSKHIVNKRRFETIEIAYEIDKLVNYWKTRKVVVEDLNFKSKLSGKGANRLCKNSWDRCLFENKLKMLSKLHGYEVVEVNPCYTSQVGNIMHGDDSTPDMVAASVEIARRGFKKFERGWFYPDFDRSLSQMNEQWKQTSSDNSIRSWKELFSLIKNSKLKYRVLLDHIPKKNMRSFSLTNKRSMIQYILFNIV